MSTAWIFTLPRVEIKIEKPQITLDIWEPCLSSCWKINHLPSVKDKKFQQGIRTLWAFHLLFRTCMINIGSTRTYDYIQTHYNLIIWLKWFEQGLLNLEQQLHTNRGSCARPLIKAINIEMATLCNGCLCHPFPLF